MESSIYVFKDINDAVRRLEKYGNTFIFPSIDINRTDIIKNCVTSNVFRAFHLIDNKPSVLFRTWADVEFDNIVKGLQKIKQQEEFDNLITEKADSLIKYWADNVSDSSQFLIYGHSIKMVNLLIKALQESKHFSQKRLIKFQHVPFDSYSLKPLINIINELANKQFSISIPTNVSMKFVNCPEIYWILTESIISLSKKAGISPIVYDYWSWNDKH
jgi:hypothetical protein